jgi:hypothetical protein
MKKLLLLLACPAIAVAVLAGCGSAGSQQIQSAPAATSAPVTTVQAPPTTISTVAVCINKLYAWEFYLANGESEGNFQATEAMWTDTVGDTSAVYQPVFNQAMTFYADVTQDGIAQAVSLDRSTLALYCGQPAVASYPWTDLADAPVVTS